WRKALSRITENGRLNGFSSNFTRYAGLEVIQPIIDSLSVDRDTVEAGREFIIFWDCRFNPPYTSLLLEVTSPESVLTTLNLSDLHGNSTIQTRETGIYNIRLTATCTLNSESR